MAIEDATQRLKDQNESGLDRRLLLPSVAVSESQKSEDDTKVNTTQIVKAVTGIGVSINDKNDLIIDALMEINQSILGLSQGSGLGNAENTLQTILRAPGRAARSVGRTARRGFETIRDFALAPLNLAIGTGKSIVRGAGSALMAGPRAIGGAVGNLFQSKSMKALVDINQKALDETTAIKESNEDIAVKVEEIAKMLSYEFKLRRQSRLDELEKERDSRNQQGVVPPVQREIVEANDDGSTTKGILGTLATILGAKFVGGKVVAGAAAVAAASSLATRKVIKGNAKGGDVLNLEESKRNQNDTSNNNQNKDSQKRSTGSKLSKFAKAGGILTGIAPILTGILDKPMEDKGYMASERIVANAVEGGLGLVDMAVEGTNQILDTLIPEEIFGLNFRARDPGTSEAFRERVLKNNSIDELLTSFIFPNAKAKREKEYLDNFTGGEEMDFLQMGEFIPPPDLLSSQQQKQIDETKKKMLDLEPMSVSESVKNMMALEPMVNSFSGGIYEAVIKRDNQIPVIELNVTPGSNINDLLEQQLENLNLSNDKGMGSMVMPISDNSVKNSTSNNTTVLNKMPLSTVDTNKVVPI